MFDLINPAENIFKLVDYLKNTKSGDFLFRGQTKDYPSCIPSIYRKAIINNSDAGNPRVPISSDVFYKSLDKKIEIKFNFLNLILGKFGKGLGHIIAQQYGLSSEAIDVTTNPVIAAFFATRQYPTYDHYSGNENNRLGVVYCFRERALLTNKVSLDFATNSIGLVHPEYGATWFFPYFKRYELEKLKDSEKILDFFRSNETIMLSLFTHPVIVDYSKTRAWLEPELCEKGFLKNNSYENTRIFRQQGGFVRPSVYWNCTVSNKVEILYWEPVRTHFFKPGLAIAEELTHVDNANGAPSIEKYYFKHTKLKIEEVNREYLWPNYHDDELFAKLRELYLSEFGDSFKSNKIDLDSEKKGILDKGYYD